MKNSQVYDEALEQASKIRLHIQENLRKAYRRIQKSFGIATETDGKELKLITDVFYYKDGGYPNENSLPRHEELLSNFVTLVKYMDFLGLRRQYVDTYLQDNGITLTLAEDAKIENININGDTRHKISEALGDLIAQSDFRTLLNKFLSQTLTIQAEICNRSDEIKHNLANTVEGNCEINKSDFMNAIRFDILSKKNKINTKIIDRERKLFTSKVEIFKKKIEKTQQASS